MFYKHNKEFNFFQDKDTMKKLLLLLSLVCISPLLHTMEGTYLTKEIEQQSTEEELLPKSLKESVTDENTDGNSTVNMLLRGATSALNGSIGIAGIVMDSCMGVSVKQAIKRGDINICVDILEKGPVPTDEEVTELIGYAIENKSKDVLGALLDFFAKNNEKPEACKLNTSLLFQVLESDAVTVEMIATFLFVEVDMSGEGRNQTALHIAVEIENQSILLVLFTILLKLNQKDQIYALDKFGETALHVAVKKNHLGLVSKFIEYNANINSTNNFGETALHLAVKENNLEIVSKLLEAEPDVNATDDDNLTVLHLAASLGYKDLVELLLNNGVTIDAQDNGQLTPIQCAMNEKHYEVVLLLLENGAYLDDKIKKQFLKDAEQDGEPVEGDVIEKEQVEELIAEKPSKASLNNYIIGLLVAGTVLYIAKKYLIEPKLEAYSQPVEASVEKESIQKSYRQ